MNKKRKKTNSAYLVLASGSPRRRQLLRQAGLEIRALPSAYEEGKPFGDPETFALLTANAKAVEVSRRLRHPAWVLAADTLVVQGRHIFAKPTSRQQAKHMLQALAGKEHWVLTGVLLQHKDLGRKIAWVEKTKVRMRKITSYELEKYLQSNEWKDKAGAYGIQGRAGAFVTQVKGCYFNVVGLPLGSVCEKLQKVGIVP
ncbi:septum formation protein Maf [bacterium]|nr:septum formation protein Maf [bacterium]